MRWLMAAVLLVALAGGTYVWRRRVAQAEDPQPRASSIISPALRSVQATVSATGVVRLRSGAEVRVGAQLSGIVTRLNVTVGSRVRKGSVIAEIDSRDLEARVNQAKGQVTVDRLALEKAQRGLLRSRALLADGLIPRQQTEDLESDVRSADAKLAKSLADQVAVETDLPYAQIRAPISGTVSSISTQAGETIAASFAAPTFVTILADDALELIAMVDETDIGNVRGAQGVHFTVETYPDREYAGVVTRIAPAGTIISGVVNYEVGIRIPKADGLKPDMTANVAITTARREALMVPEGSLHRSGERRFVYVSRNGKLLRRYVTPGASSEGFTEIKQGLVRNEKVALVGPVHEQPLQEQTRKEP